MFFNKNINTREKILEVIVIVVVIGFIILPFLAFAGGVVGGFFMSIFSFFK